MFDNKTIKAPVAKKPHICFREGYWRISRLDFWKNGGFAHRWDEAHRFAQRKNTALRLRQLNIIVDSSFFKVEDLK